MNFFKNIQIQLFFNNILTYITKFLFIVKIKTNMKIINRFTEWLKNVPPVIFFVVMLFISVIWMKYWFIFFWDDGKFISKEQLSIEIWEQHIIAFREELLWRLLPFMIASIVWIIGMRLKIPGLILVVITTFPIIFVQIQFGLAHMMQDQYLRIIMDLPAIPEMKEKLYHIVLQGGMGIVLSLTYLKYLLQSKGLFRYVHIIPFLICCLIHTLTNQVIMYLGSY